MDLITRHKDTKFSQDDSFDAIANEHGVGVHEQAYTLSSAYGSAAQHFGCCYVACCTWEKDTDQFVKQVGHKLYPALSDLL